MDARYRLLLLVEDNEGYSYLTRRLLQAINPDLEVAVARDGHEALAFLAGRRPHLLLLDLVMPSLSGLDLLQTLKGAENTAGIPAVVLTGYRDDRNVWSAYHQFANAVLIKPDDPEELQVALNALNDFWFAHVLLPSETAVQRDAY